MIIRNAFHRFMRPDDDKGGGGAVDRGDNWTPTDDDAAAQAEALREAEAKAAADAADKEALEKVGLDDKGDDKGAKDDGKKGDDKKGDDKKAKDTRVPLARHTEILSKERERREAAERELAAMRGGQEAVKVGEKLTEAEEKISAMEGEYLKLLEKGDVSAAATKMTEIRRAERGIIETRAKYETQAAEARAYERVRYDTTVERLEAAYPVMNPDHEDYDKSITAELCELRDGYVATGRYTRAEAIQKAAKVLLKPATAKQEAAVEVDVRVDKDEVAKQVAAERKKAAVEKNLDTAGKQPASAANVGRDTDKAGGTLKGTDVIKMSQKEFAKLSESDLAKLRGDEA